MLRLQFAAGDGTKEVDVPSGSTLQDLQQTVKRAFPAMKNKACQRQPCAIQLQICSAVTPVLRCRIILMYSSRLYTDPACSTGTEPAAHGLQ